MSSTDQAAAPVALEEKAEKTPTKYVVMTSESKDGPWKKLGEFDGHGQMGAKKAAAVKLGDEAEKLFFLAIPHSSYVPQKPAVKVTTSINF